MQEEEFTATRPGIIPSLDEMEGEDNDDSEEPLTPLRQLAAMKKTREIASDPPLIPVGPPLPLTRRGAEILRWFERLEGAAGEALTQE